MTTPSKCPPQAALDAELKQIAALDGVIRSAQAEQFVRIEAARLLAAEVEGVTDDSSSADREFATRAFVAEIATALTAHEATAGGLVADAAKLTGGFTATLEALATGAICLGRARTLLDVASSLPAGSAGAFEAAALERAASETPSAFRRRIRRLRERLHPEPLTDRRQHARAERRVCFEPVEDGMAWLNLYLEAERGVAIIANLDAVAAAQQRAADAVDPRTGTQLKLDLAAGLLLGTAGGAIPGPLDSPLGVVSPRVYVTVPVLTLLGHSDAPAELDGYGPIDAETARRLAAHAPSFQRILTHPETGAYLSYGRDKYRVPADLAGYLRVRDGVCRFPGCSRTAVRCDIDHTDDWAAHGETSHCNLAHLCRKHHRLKHKTRWRMQQQPGGDIRWTSPPVGSTRRARRIRSNRCVRQIHPMRLRSTRWSRPRQRGRSDQATPRRESCRSGMSDLVTTRPPRPHHRLGAWRPDRRVESRRPLSPPPPPEARCRMDRSWASDDVARATIETSDPKGRTR